MTYAFAAPVLAADVRAQRRSNGVAWGASYALVLVVSCGIGLFALRDVPAPWVLSLTVLMLSSAAILARPSVGVHLCVGLALLGDANLAPWYPFTKNASSAESMFFVHPALILSPLDLLLLVTTASWMLSRLGLERRPFERGRLFVPVVAFAGFVVLGLLHGLGTGGDRSVALWEVRPLLYLPVIYVLATNLFTRREQIHRLFWVIAAAITVEGAYGLGLLLFRPDELSLDGTSLIEHSAAMHANTLFVLALVAWLLPQVSRHKRLVLPLMGLVVITTYLTSERRSAFIGLVVAGVFLAIVLYRLRRRAFYLLVPALAVGSCLYVAATWNATGAVGFPAQAVKTVVAPEQMSEADQLSGAYRDVETYNLVETIKASPVLGMGLGHRFLRPLPLPDISFFVWWEYIPHNSILWIWTQLGVGGFLVMLYLFGSAIAIGARATSRLGAGDDAALTLTASLVLVMFLVYAYVDIAWDAQSTLLLGAALAVVANHERLCGLGPDDAEPALASSGSAP